MTTHLSRPVDTNRSADAEATSDGHAAQPRVARGRPSRLMVRSARPVLFVTIGSHPSWSVRLMLEHKEIEYRRVDLLLLVYKPVLKLLRFRRATLPILRLGGRSIQGTRAIARELDVLVAEPALFPADARHRGLVEQAEQWGEEVLQEVARRVAWWTVRRDRSGVRSYLAGTHVGIPHAIVAACTLPFAIISCSLFGANDDVVRRDLANLPRALDRIDNWLADGVLGGEQLTAADFQIAPSLMLLMSFDDIRPLIEYRPAGRFARRVASQYPGRTAAVTQLRSLLVELVGDARSEDSTPVAR